MNYKLSVPEVVKIVVFLCALLGTWYSMKHNVDSLTIKVDKLERQLENNNLGVIKNDIEYIKQSQLELKNDLRQYYNIVNDLIVSED